MPLSLAGKAFAAVIALGSVGAYELAPPDARGQTEFLQRLADRVEHARTIAPETATRISDLLARMRAQPPRGGELDTRRRDVMARLETALQAKAASAGELAAQTSPVARR
jgi:hypothetical protein